MAKKNLSSSIGSPFPLIVWPLNLRFSYPHFTLSSSIDSLAFEEIQSSEKRFNSTALVLHGLLGSGRNLRSFAQNLIAQLKESSSNSDVRWRMILVDLRNHGRSTEIKGLDPPHDMANTARDLVNLVKSHGWAWPDVVIGHSMGGKVALEYAASCARGDFGDSALIPKQVWVLDSVPGVVNSDSSNGEIEKVLHVLHSLPSSFPSRKCVVDHMLSIGFSKLVAKWMGSNLKNQGDRVVWAFDLPNALDMFKSYREESYWPLLEHPPKGLEISMVHAANSDRWRQPVIQKLKSLVKKGEVSYYLLPRSGHWVHVDNPKGLLHIMAPNFYPLRLLLLISCILRTLVMQVMDFAMTKFNFITYEFIVVCLDLVDSICRCLIFSWWFGR